MKHILPIVYLASLAILTAAQDFVDVNNVNLDANDIRRYYYCGNSFWDAIDKCGTWCPNDDDNECPDGEECFGDTYCKYTADLDGAAATDTSGSATVVATTPAASMITTIAAAVTTAESSTISAIGTVPTQQPSQSAIPSNQPTWQVSTQSSFQNVAEDEEDWSQLEQDGNSSEEEEDWSQVGETQNLWCGTSQFDAIRNCGTGTKCDNGICPGILKCFVVPGTCGSDSEADGESGTSSTSLANSDEDEDWSALTGTTSAPSTTTYSISTSPTTHSVGYDDLSSTNETITSPTIPPVPTAPNTSPTFPLPEVPSESDATDTLFCGYTLEDASTACHKRCRSGSPGECPAGETCFRGVECTSENPRPPPTQQPTQPPTPEPTIITSSVQLKSLCAEDYGELVSTCYSALECNSTNPCPQNQTCFEDIDCLVTSYSLPENPTLSHVPSSLANNDLRIKQNYCAMNEIDLYANCSVAPTCNDGDPPCPFGTVCFGEHLCGSKESLAPSLQDVTVQIPSQAPSPLDSGPSFPSEPQLLCASDISELEASCSDAESCNDGPCTKGMFCFPYNCESSTGNEPAVSDGKTYYCAQNEAELKQSCGMLTQCNNGLPPCSEGLTCFEYTCEQSIELCPLNYVGWQSSRDCIEYYGCEDGVAGQIKACPDGLKFDKMRGECGDASLLDEYCYGPPVPKPTPRPTGPPLAFCQKDVNGWHTSPDCKEYYKCQNGEAGAIQVCSEGFLFDKVRGGCRSESDVNNFCYGPPLVSTESPQASGNDLTEESPKTENESPQISVNDLIEESPKTENGSCSKGFTGWQASTDCSKYYWCDDGLTGNQYDCGDGLLFDRVNEICTFADEVECASKDTGHAITSLPTRKLTTPPSLSKVWSDTTSPTVSQNTSADPPWLTITRKDDENNASFNSVLICIQLPAFLFLFMITYT